MRYRDSAVIDHNINDHLFRDDKYKFKLRKKNIMILYDDDDINQLIIIQYLLFFQRFLCRVSYQIYC